jgi:Tfp pilus assembly protein PilX
MGCQSPWGTPYTTARMTSWRRDHQRGNSLLRALIVMSALATLGSLTVVSVQSSLKASTNDRAGSIAMYAAESGIALAIEFLRTNWTAPGTWAAYIRPNNTPTVTPAFPSNGASPEDSNNPFGADQNAWFLVETLNNRSDTGYVGGTDNDDQILLRATGHGPQGSVAIIECEIRRYPLPPTPPPSPLTSTTPVILVSWHIVL